MNDDKTLESLLDLDGIKMVIDDKLDLWIKFVVNHTLINKVEWSALFAKSA